MAEWTRTLQVGVWVVVIQQHASSSEPISQIYCDINAFTLLKHLFKITKKYFLDAMQANPK